MVTIEITLLVISILIFIALYYFLKVAKYLIANTVLGLIIILLSKFIIGMNIVITPIILLICAIGGIPGAILVIIYQLLS